MSNPLNPLYYAVSWVMTQIHTGLSLFLSPGSGLAWVLTIALLVVIMRLILVPLFIKQMHATRKMSALAPQIRELQKKYKNDKQTLNAEMMRLYKENGANPLAGCLPLLGQMPMFFALFSVLRAIANWKPGSGPVYAMPAHTVASARLADILGAHIPDKFLFPLAGQSMESRIVILGFVIVSVVTTFLTVRQGMKRGMNPQMMTPDNPMAQSQKYMAYIVPLFALSGLYWAFGLVMYWVATNIWTLGQQYVLLRRYPMPAVGGVAGSGQSPAGKGSSSGQSPARKGPGGAGKSAAGPTGVAKPVADSGTDRASGNGSGVLRRLTRGKAEPEQQPSVPQAKLVRQQRTRQSRSKRSGKR